MFNPHKNTPRQAMAREAKTELANYLSTRNAPFTDGGIDNTGTRQVVSDPDIAEHMLRTSMGTPAYYPGLSQENRDKYDRARADGNYSYRNDPNNPTKKMVQALGPRPLQLNPPPELKAPRPKGILGTIANSVARGVDQFQGNLYEAEHAVGRALDSESIKQNALEGIQRNEKEAAQHPREIESYDKVLARDESGNIKPWDSLKRAGTYAAEVTSENLMNAASMLIPGGIGAKVGRTVIGETAALAARAAGTVTKAEKVGGVVGASVGAMPGHVGEIEQEQRQLDNPASFGKELGVAALRTALDVAPLERVVSTVIGAEKAVGLSGILKNAAKVAAVGAITEAPTEAAQEALAIALHMNQDQNYDPINNSEQRAEAIQRLAESFVAGGVAGGVMAGVGGAAHAALPSAPDVRKAAAQKIADLEAMNDKQSQVVASAEQTVEDVKGMGEQQVQELPPPNVVAGSEQSGQPIQPAPPQSPRVQVGADPNGYLNHNAQIYRDIADKSGLTSDIEELFSTGQVAKMVTHQLKDKLNSIGIPLEEQASFVVSVRATLGIPSRATEEGKAEFDKWQAEYQQRKNPQPQPPSSEALSPSPTIEAVSDEVKANTLAAVKRIDQHYSDYTPGLQDSEYEQDDEDNQPQDGEDLSPAEEQGLQSKENALVRGRMIYGGNGDPMYMDSSKDSVPDNKIVAQVGGYQTPVGSGLSRLQKVAGEKTKLVGIDDKGNVVDVTQYAGKQDNVEAAKEAMTGIQRIIAIPADATDLHEAVIKASQQPEVHSLRPMADKWVVESSHASERGANGYTQMEEAMALRTASKLGQDKLMAKTAMNKVNPDGSLELNKKGEPVTYMMDAMTLTKIGRRQDSVTTMEDATDADKRKWFLDGLATARLHGYTPVGMPKGNDASINDAEELQQSLDSLNSAGVDKQNFRGKGGVQITEGKDFNDTRVKPFESDLSEADIQGIADGSIKQEDVAASIVDLNHLKSVVESLPEDAPVTKAKLRNLLAQAKGKVAGAKLDPTRSPAVDTVLDSLTVYPNDKGKVKQSTRGYLGKLIGDELYRQNRLQRELENPNDTVTEESRKDQDMYGEFPEQEASEGIRSMPAKPGDVDSANAFINAYKDWQDAGAKPEARSEALSKVYRPDYALNPSLSFDDHFTTGADPNETLNGMVDKARTIANSAGRVVGEDRNTAAAQTEVKSKIEALRTELKALEEEEGITGNVQLESGTKIHIPNVDAQITSLQDRLQNQRKKGSKAQLEALRAQIKEADAVIDNKESTRAEKAAAESTLADLMTRFDRLNAPRSPATHGAIETQLKTLQSQVKAAKVSDAAGDIRNQISALEAQLPKQNPDEYAKGDGTSIPDDREDAYEKDNIAQRQKPVTPVRKTATIHERVENHHNDKRVHGFLSDISNLLGIKTRFAVVDEDGVKSYGDSLRQSVADQKERVGKAMKTAESADLYDDNEQLRADMRDELQHLMRNVPIDEVKQIELMEAMIARLKDGEQLGTVPQPKQFENLSRKDWENVKPVFSMIARVHAGDDTVIQDWVDYLNKADQSADLQMDTADFVAKRLEQAQSSRSKKGWIHYMDDMEYAEDRVPVIFVSKNLKGVEKIRVAAHEMGHLIMRTSLQDLINRRESDPDAREVIDKIFGKGVDWKNDASIQDASENFAEMTMQWVNSNKTPKTLVEKWFSKLVDELKELWASLTAELKLSNKTEQVENFNAFMNGLMYKANSMGMVYENGKLVDKTNKMMRDGKEVYIPADFRRFKEAIEGLSLSETLPKRPAEMMSDYFGQDIVDAAKNSPIAVGVKSAGVKTITNLSPMFNTLSAEARSMNVDIATRIAQFIRPLPGEVFTSTRRVAQTNKRGFTTYRFVQAAGVTLEGAQAVFRTEWNPKVLKALENVPKAPSWYDRWKDPTKAAADLRKQRLIIADLLAENPTVQTQEAQDIRDLLVEIYNRYGKELNMGQRDNYFRHIYDAGKMTADGAAADIVDALMKYEKVNKVEAKKIYDRMVNTAGTSIEDLFAFGAFDRDVRANSLQFKNKVKFSDEMRKFMAEYSDDDIHKIVTKYVESINTRLAWQREFGDYRKEAVENPITGKITLEPKLDPKTGKIVWDPIGQINNAIEAASLGHIPGTASAGMLNPKQAVYLKETMLPALQGTLGMNMDPGVRKLVDGVKTILNVGLLAGATLSSLVDPVGIMVRSGDSTDVRKQLRVIREMWRGATSAEQREYGEIINIINNAFTDSVLNGSTNGDMASDWMKTVNDKFFRAIGLHWWTNTMRTAALSVAKMDIKYQYEKALNGDALAIEKLKRLSLTTQDVADWIASGNSGDKMFNVDTMSPQMIQALHRWVDQGVMRPSSIHKPPIGSDRRAAWFWYLHDFQWSYYNTTMKQVAQSVRDEKGVAKALPVLFFAMASLPLVALGYELRKMIFNKAPAAALGIKDRTEDKEGLAYLNEIIHRWGILGPASMLEDYRVADKRGDIAALGLLGVPTEKTIELLNDGLGSFLLHTTPLIAQSRPLRDALTPYLNPAPPRSEKRRKVRD
jgi:hypothetical protein